MVNEIEHDVTSLSDGRLLVDGLPMSHDAYRKMLAKERNTERAEPKKEEKEVFVDRTSQIRDSKGLKKEEKPVTQITAERRAEMDRQTAALQKLMTKPKTADDLRNEIKTVDKRSVDKDAMYEELGHNTIGKAKEQKKQKAKTAADKRREKQMREAMSGRR